VLRRARRHRGKEKECSVSTTLAHWFSSEGFMPHGHCYLWTPELLWTFLAADSTIALAYYSIPAALVYLVHKRRQTSFNWMFLMFSLFIFACGTTHLVSIWTIWHPDYWLDAGVKVFTAIVSITTAVLLWPLIPRIAQMPTSRQLRKIISQLEHEIEERKRAEDALRQSQATLRELAAYQEHIREDERKRIAREIHDDLGQNLLALRLDAGALHDRAGERHPLLRRRAADAIEHIDMTMKSIRSIMNNLRPSVLDLGLQAAIEWQVRQFEARNGVPCELTLHEDGAPVPEEQAVAAFRILQESLNNIGRHARATAVHVELRIRDSRLTMTIRDNGVGMFPGDRRKAHRFGLVGIQERVTILGGEFALDSMPGHGTILRISIPLGRPGANGAATPVGSLVS
jgi:signal transduction histidine kinase